MAVITIRDSTHITVKDLRGPEGFALADVQNSHEVKLVNVIAGSSKRIDELLHEMRGELRIPGGISNEDLVQAARAILIARIETDRVGVATSGKIGGWLRETGSDVMKVIDFLLRLGSLLK